MTPLIGAYLVRVMGRWLGMYNAASELQQIAHIYWSHECDLINLFECRTLSSKHVGTCKR